MAKIDRQIITLSKIEDDAAMRQYSAVSGECAGVATVNKDTLDYSYTGDNLEEFASFVKDTLTKSIKLGKKLPDKFSHGFG